MRESRRNEDESAEWGGDWTGGGTDTICSAITRSRSFSLSARRAYMRDRALPGEAVEGPAGGTELAKWATEFGGFSGSVFLGEVTAEGEVLDSGHSSGIAKDAARAASIVESKWKSSRDPSRDANSRSGLLAVFGCVCDALGLIGGFAGDCDIE